MPGGVDEQALAGLAGLGQKTMVGRRLARNGKKICARYVPPHKITAKFLGDLIQHLAVKIQFQIPRVLQQSSVGDLELEIDGTTVGELLDEVQRRDPELYRCICDETGSLRQHINLFLNDDLFDRTRFDTRLTAGDVVSVFQSVSGG